MRINPVLFVITLMGASAPVAAQDVAQRCANTTGIRYNACIERENAKVKAERDAAEAAGTPLDTTTTSKKAKGKNKEAAAANELTAAANAKSAAKDFAGAAELYRTAIAANPKGPLVGRYYTGMAIAQRQEAIAAFNSVPRPAALPAGSTNDQIRAANAAHAAAQRLQLSSSLPLFQRAQATAAQAATYVAAGTDRDLDEPLARELREDAAILYQLDRTTVLSIPRAGVDYEATALRAWLVSDPAAPPATVARFGYATAAALAAKDASAGLTLADEVLARSTSDADGVLGYAEIVAAKTTKGDPRRAKALAALAQIEPTIADAAKKASLVRLKTVLSA